MPRALNREEVLINIRRAYYLSSFHAFSHPLFDDYALPPLQAMIEPTYRCNIRCQMCPFLPLLSDSSAFDNRGEEISVSEIMDVVRLIPHVSLVTLTGGEPLLRGDFIDIVSSIAQRNKISIVTNGVLLERDLARALVALRSRAFLDRGFFLLFFSIHGPAAIHDQICQIKGTWQRAINGIRRVQQEKQRRRSPYPLISFNSVITRWNYHALGEVFQVAEQLGVDFCNFSLRTYSLFPNRFGKDRVDFEQAASKDFSPTTVEDRDAFDARVLAEQLDSLVARARESRVKLSFLPRGTTPADVLGYYTVEEKRGMEDFSCFSPWWRFLLTAYGDVTSCPNFFVGNIRDGNIREIWNNQHQRRFRRMLRQGLPSFCSKCDMSEK